LCDLGSAKPLPNHNKAIDFIRKKKASGKKKAIILPGFDKRGSVFYISTRHYRAPELILGNKYYGV
jgi:serine/threonine protein kinase